MNGQQAMSNMQGEAAARRHVLALLEEWEEAVASAADAQVTAADTETAWLIEAGDKLAAALELTIREYRSGEDDEHVQCATPDDCPRGPEPHPYVPPADDHGALICCRQPWEGTP